MQIDLFKLTYPRVICRNRQTASAYSPYSHCDSRELSEDRTEWRQLTPFSNKHRISDRSFFIKTGQPQESWSKEFRSKRPKQQKRVGQSTFITASEDEDAASMLNRNNTFKRKITLKPNFFKTLSPKKEEKSWLMQQKDIILELKRKDTKFFLEELFPKQTAEQKAYESLILNREKSVEKRVKNKL